MANLTRTDSIEDAFKAGAISPTTPSTVDGDSQFSSHSPRSTTSTTESHDVTVLASDVSFGEARLLARGSDFDCLRQEAHKASAAGKPESQTTQQHEQPMLKAPFAQKQQAWNLVSSRTPPMATDVPSKKLSTASESEETTEVIEKRCGFCMRYREKEGEIGLPASSHLSSPVHCAAAATPEDFAAVASLRQPGGMPVTVLTRDPPRSQAGDAPKASSGYVSGGFAQAKGALREFELNTTPSMPAAVHETANTSAEIHSATRVPFVQRRAAARGLQEQTDGAHAPAQPVPVVVEKNRATASFAERRFAARFPDEFSGMNF